VNSDLLSSSDVMFGTDASYMYSTAKGTGAAYTQLLAPSSGNLVTPSMGAPGASAAAIVALANTSTFAYDHATGKKWANYRNIRTYATGQLLYSNPYAYYDSPIIHTTILTGLVAGMTYYYQPAGACKVYSFTMIPAVNTYPFKAALVADLGTTAVSAMSVSVLAAMKASVVIFTGDLSYADGWVPTWDVFGLMIEPLASAVPILSVGGNHELGSTENWQSYAARYPTNSQDSASPNLCYHGREVGPMNIISLCSYGAANFAGLNTGANSLQFQWLTNYLATVDRTRTPWLMVQFHVPVYCTNSGHYMEGEIFRRQYEPLLYKYGVDIVMNGHVHAYERSFPVYNNTVDPCGITHLVLGDGGNYENAYVPWIDPAQPWSAFREASFGVASLNVLSATQANYTWHRHACGSLSTGAPNYSQNFSKSCVTPKDNSANVALSVDSYIMTKPSKAACPNRYTTQTIKSVASPTPGPTVAAGAYMPNSGYLRKEEIADVARVLPESAQRVDFKVADFQGDEYRRLIEPMPQFTIEAATCASSQVSISTSNTLESDA
jgi:acid phosphatase type 7